VQPQQDSQKMEKARATFAAGCFWCVDATFRALPGVTATRSGYTGGSSRHPNYLSVCALDTGHAEAVQVTYDPQQLAYEKLLEVFWECHDPTQLNRQGRDVGKQYRSAIFYHTPEQERLARASKQAMQESGRFAKPIVTEIVSAAKFHRAENFHQIVARIIGAWRWLKIKFLKKGNGIQSP
jgi:peptide-methionine (S)-S-oxide reductase